MYFGQTGTDAFTTKIGDGGEHVSLKCYSGPLGCRPSIAAGRGAGAAMRSVYG
jgi:hypothetical protein